jgi:hypothetical protein
LKKKPTIQAGQHGGPRPNSGRPPGISTKILERQDHARKLLDSFGGDKAWMWAIQKAKAKNDYHAVADILKYWTDRAEGKAPQAITGPEGEQLEMTVHVIAGRAEADS